MRWVRLHPYNISQKVQIVVEHFRENVASLLNGQAKAMVVVGSRLEAVRWEQAIEKEVLVQQALSNTEEQFAGSPDLQKFFMDALIESYSAQNALDRAALNSPAIQADVLGLLLGPAQLRESLRSRSFISAGVKRHR